MSTSSPDAADGPEQDGTAATAAAIVAYHPDPANLLALVETIAPEVGRIILFCNSLLPPDLHARLLARPEVALIEAGQNLGIGAGLNIAALASAWDGYRLVVFFDQDSRPRPGTIQALRTAHAQLSGRHEKPAVVAPTLVAADRASKPPRYHARSRPGDRQEPRAVDFVPTSGSLVAVAALRQIGFFRADYFIDGIDLEWCFRARARGLSCWVLPAEPMPHSVGSGVIAWPWLGFRMPLQRPFRMYCTVRNTLYGLRLPHIPLAWKARQLAYLPLQIAAYAIHHRGDRTVLGLLAGGLADGLRGRLGEPRGLPPAGPA